MRILDELNLHLQNRVKTYFLFRPFSRTLFKMGKRKKESKKKSINLGSEADQWMSDLPESLWAVPLSNLSLPGK